MIMKFAIAWGVVFVAWMAGSFVVHGLPLHDDYAKLPRLFCPETDAQKYFPLMILAHVIMAGAFVRIYSRGVEPKPWLPQGLRFGAEVVRMTVVPTYTIHYVVQPMPGVHVIKQIILDGLLVVVLAVIAAAVCRKNESMGQ